MPLVRVPVRNEYGLGHPELYRDADREDPKALLEGVAVAGLVGILRQLGDLAEFAAEVFHGLQEQVMSTSSRGHKLMVRVQRIEAILPPIEKAMLAQKSHIHFAYTTGSVWRARLQIEQNHFIYGDLPHFVMDSYEECSDPPRLHLLDKFDNGGPGSCLKRYSDPTFFKKASAVSSEANVNKLSKCRKPHRSKKKRKWQRTVFSRGPSVSSRTDRTQFASLKASGQISPSQTVSIFDSTIKSDQEDQSKTFDLRTDSGYIECVFHPACPIKPEEHEPEQSTFSNLEMLQNDTFDLASVDECSNAVDDDFRQSSVQEQIEASSSSVTWDEKTEIVEPNGHQVEHVETAEIHRMDFNGDTDDEGAVNNNNVGKIDVSVDNEGILTSISSPIRLDDLESEPENYMDALNTIELESETDVDFQTKREMEQSFNCNNDRAKDEIHVHMAHLPDDVPSNQTKQEVEQSCTFKADGTNDGTYEFIVDNSDCQPTDLESCSAAHNASYEESSFDNPISSQFFAHKELPQPNGESSNNSNSLDMEFCSNNILESSNKETDIIKIPFSGPEELNQQAPTSNEVKTPSGEHSSPKEPSGVQSVQFWTNGGLLGLEPSKPPVFSAQNAASQDPKASGTDVAKSSATLSNIVSNNRDVRKSDELVQSSEVIERNSSNCSTSYRDDGNVISDKKTTWRFLSTVLDAKREKNGYFQLSNSFNNNFGHSFSRINGSIPKNELKIDADVRAVHTEASQGDFSDASQISKLSNRIPANDFQRSLAYDQKTESPGSRKTANFEQKCKSQGLAYRTLSDRTLKGCYGNESPIFSPSSSPPLQHMKISFEPIDGLGTSKLKLKFPTGIFRQESSRDMLPSFQLVPEPAAPQHDIVPDSDDDTFCRSSPYMSDDCISNDSESNSEQWDSDDNPRNKDNEMYDAIRSISLKESISSSLVIEEIGHEGIEVDYGFQSSYADNCAESCQSNRLPNLPSLSTLNPLFEQEMKSSCDTKNLPESHFLTEHSPLPPPLPPSQWRNMKFHSSNVTITKQESISEALDHGIDVNILGSTIFPQIKPNLVRQQLDNNEAVALSPKGEPERQRSSGLKEVNQPISGIAIDEKEDFLHQIRTQSFNLRRTMTDKPNVTAPGPTANAKVTAILEKANAIRQAVGSEHGEDDDNWSDT